ncbi:rhodanese-like domain-containing protein [Endozoicomonas sp. G2_1]|uniref:rhodanese-like domain-containing protein n=1 Tax=Endozoicomonas sp. G2_1 TaxID=2821091 RepID=UPI001ADC1625|nr:rhodanese-like domain-containing protein [Endozoicomonas sp. G2_1]MBO9491841.1 rhodanese-like domain-containing protein [Endozoicomonas sp. G2_1]
MDQYISFFSNHALLSAAWVAIIVALIFTTVKMQFSPVKQVSPQDLTFLVNRQEGIVVDIRTEKEFRTSHILSAKHLSTEKVNNNDFGGLEKNKDKPIIVVCTAGITAVKVAEQLAKAGFSQVNLLKGGMNAWLNAGLPLAKK